MSQSHSHHTDQPVMPHHEEGDIQMGVIFKSVIYLAVFTAIVQALTYYFMVAVDNRALAGQEIRYPLAAQQGDRLPPAPRLQTLPREELTALRDSWKQGLEGYSWVDKNAGTVRVPIETAMKRVLERGLPVRSAQTAVPAADTSKPAVAVDATKPVNAPAQR